MENEGFKELKNLDREKLISDMKASLGELLGALNMSLEELSRKSGIDISTFKAVEEGKEDFKWSQFLTLLFVFWKNDKSKGIVEEKGLFPDELKSAMSVNRNAHQPTPLKTQI